MPRFCSIPLALSIPFALATNDAHAQLPVHHLDNGTIRASVTEAIGGRLLSFSLVGKPNFLLVKETAGDPQAPVDATTNNIGYLGHEVWIGPQSQWWQHQSVNPTRAAAKAPWPPDPYLSLARYTLESHSDRHIELDSPASPVNGIALRKRYALVDGQPNTLELKADATNRRATDVAWDLWFNTRVRPDTMVYVPVSTKKEVRIEPAAALAYTLADGILSLDLPQRGQPARKGKLFAQPSAGWMAGFHSGQAFIVQFAHQPRAAIHPEQGQVELYLDADPASPDKGLLEMEVHAPYRRLAPNAGMSATERWTILPYDGPATRDGHVAFLRKQAARLKLER